MSDAKRAVEACENGNATPLQQKSVAKYFRDAWMHEGANAERLDVLRNELVAQDAELVEKQKYILFLERNRSKINDEQATKERGK